VGFAAVLLPHPKSLEMPFDGIAGFEAGTVDVVFEELQTSLDPQGSAAGEKLEIGAACGLGTVGCDGFGAEERLNAEFMDGDIGLGAGTEGGEGEERSNKSPPLFIAFEGCDGGAGTVGDVAEKKSPKPLDWLNVL